MTCLVIAMPPARAAAPKTTAESLAAAKTLVVQNLLSEAKTFAACRAANNVCGCDAGEAYVSTILNRLNTALALAPEQRNQIVADTAWAPVRETVQFQLWVGNQLITDEQIKEVLMRTKWYLSPMVLRSNVLTFTSPTQFKVVKGDFLKADIVGSYLVKNQMIRLKFKATKDSKNLPAVDAGKIYVLMRENDGLSFALQSRNAKLKDAQLEASFRDYPDDCSD